MSKTAPETKTAPEPGASYAQQPPATTATPLAPANHQPNLVSNLDCGLTIIEGKIYGLDDPALKGRERPWVERMLWLNLSEKVGGIQKCGILFDENHRGVLETPGKSGKKVLQVGLRARVLVKIKAREYEGNAYNTLAGLAIEVLSPTRGWYLLPERAATELPVMGPIQQQQYLTQQAAPAAEPEPDDDLPF